MKPIPFAVAAFSLAMAASAAAGPALRVMSFNIRYDNAGDGPNRWETRRDSVAALIRREADVAALQEVLPGQRSALVAALAEFASVGRTREADEAKGEGCPIFYRKDRFTAGDSGTFWLSDTPEVPGSRSWGNDLPRICTWVDLRDASTGRTIRVFNLHLDHRSAEARKRGAALVVERARAFGGMAIALGDFNEGAGAPGPSAFTAAGWADAWKSCGQGDAGTFNGWKAEGPFPTHIDHIFSRGLAATACRILREKTPGGGWVSDHFPVWAAFPPETTPATPAAP